MFRNHLQHLQNSTVIHISNLIQNSLSALLLILGRNSGKRLSELSSKNYRCSRIIRIVAKVNRLDHTNDLFTKQSILKFVDLARLKEALIVHKAKFKTLPPTLQIKFNLNSDVVILTLRSACHFKITYVRSQRARARARTEKTGANQVNWREQMREILQDTKIWYI